MLYNLTRIPILLLLLVGLGVFLVGLQPSVTYTVVGQEEATSTPAIEEKSIIATTTATSTGEALLPQLASSTATSSEENLGTFDAKSEEKFEAERVQLEEGTHSIDEVRDCLVGEGRYMFQNPGGCLRELRENQ